MILRLVVLPMSTPDPSESLAGRYTGVAIDVVGTGRIQLTDLIQENSDTSIYHTSHHGIVAKMFDLRCEKAGELSHGPYLSYGLELENFQDIQSIENLRPLVPSYFGGGINQEERYAFIIMEFLEGMDLQSWCDEGAIGGYETEWADEFRKAIYETLYILTMFHQHGIILTDFKPDNVIRLYDGRIKFVDLGAFFTPRHGRETEKYVYSATPDYAELVIDTSNVQTGMALNQASDIFAAGVALFEMVTRNSRLSIADETADAVLANPQVYLFRDSQIKDIWLSYPHLEELLPLIQTQLKERRILFSELWHLLKGHVANELDDWESLSQEQHDEIILATGTNFIRDQLPPQLQWLADPIAQATTLRGMRLKTVADLMKLVAIPISDSVREDLQRHNCFVQYLCDLEHSIEFVTHLNAWEVRWNQDTEYWAIATSCAWHQFPQEAESICLKLASQDEQCHKFFQIVTDLEADDFQGKKLTLEDLKTDPLSWIGYE